MGIVTTKSVTKSQFTLLKDGISKLYELLIVIVLGREEGYLPMQKYFFVSFQGNNYVVSGVEPHCTNK